MSPRTLFRQKSQKKSRKSQIPYTLRRSNLPLDIYRNFRASIWLKCSKSWKRILRKYSAEIFKLSQYVFYMFLIWLIIFVLFHLGQYLKMVSSVLLKDLWQHILLVLYCVQFPSIISQYSSKSFYPIQFSGFPESFFTNTTFARTMTQNLSFASVPFENHAQSGADMLFFVCLYLFIFWVQFVYLAPASMRIRRSFTAVPSSSLYTSYLSHPED